MKIEKAIETLKMENELMQFDPNTGEDYPIELQNQDNQDLYKANLVAIKALTKQLIDENCNPFKWQKCKRKNGSEFLKLIYYSRTVDGYVEVGRFNMSKQELVQNEWSLNEIYEELSNE
jgi:hypothetical protein